MDHVCKISNFEEPLLTNPTKYRRFVGKLMYLIISRSNITYVVNRLKQFVTNPRGLHLHVNHLLKFLKLNQRKCLFLSIKPSSKIQPFTHSEWAGCPNTRQLVFGFCIFIGYSLISLKSKKKNHYF